MMKHISQVDPAGPEVKARIATSRTAFDRRTDQIKPSLEETVRLATAQPTPAVME